MVEAAWAASHTSTYLGAQSRRLAKRLKGKKALVAVAHSLLTIVYHVLNENTPYRELGHDFFCTIAPTWNAKRSGDSKASAMRFRLSPKNPQRNYF